jgi:hypothetical protein
MTRRLARFAPVSIAVLIHAGAPADAQTLPDRPVELAGGQVVLSAQVDASMAADDRPGYFNHTDYEHSVLRLFQAALTAAWRPATRLAFLAEVRTENLDTPRVYAAFVRIRPWAGRAFDIQAGRIPPSFGAFGRRAYGLDNPVVGYPLAYQYLTSLRADALPASADDLLARRGRGWRVAYPIGQEGFDAGLPLVSSFRWDTGLQVRAGGKPLEATAAVTAGTLSNPGTSDHNGGVQVSGRIALRPGPAWVLGFSAARGPFAARVATSALPPHATGGRPTQTAWGADAEYSRGHWLVRGELVHSSWSLPAVDEPRITRPLEALGAWIETRYRLTPRVYVAGRADRLGFSTIEGTLFDGAPTPWDARVVRLEMGGGYYVRRNVVLRAVYQYNHRDDTRTSHRHFVAGQGLYWF